MSSETDPLNTKALIKRRPAATALGWSLRRGRPRVPTIRLGGKKGRRGVQLARICRKAKLRWLKMKYLLMMKKLKKWYKEMVKEMMEGSAASQSFQQRMLLEASFAVPVLGLYSW